MLIAVFGDLHGRIKLAYKLCRRWQAEHKEQIDLILQVGDLGVWPDISKLDKATLRHAEKEIDELGFQEFLEGSRELDELLRSVEADLYFTEGNHADFEFLRECAVKNRPTYPIDFYGRLNYIASGNAFELRKGSERIVAGAVSGIDKSLVQRPGRRPDEAYFSERDLQRLSMQKDVNVLLTHHGPVSKRQMYSESIHSLVKALAPQYHFYGHLHIEEEIKNEDNTLFVQLNQLAFRDKSGRLTRQAFGILDWKNKNNNNFKFVADPWLEEFTKYTWESI